MITAAVDNSQPVGLFLMVDTYSGPFSPFLSRPLNLPDPPLFQAFNPSPVITGPTLDSGTPVDVFGDPTARIQLGPIDAMGFIVANTNIVPSSNDLIDELAIADFGTTWANATAACANWALSRYKDGRYSRDEGRFLSAPLAPTAVLGAPSRLLKAWWTASLPSDRRMDLPDGTADISVLPQYLPAAGLPRRQDSLAQGQCQVSVDLLDASGTLASAPLQGLTQGGAINRDLPYFRYRVGITAQLTPPPQRSTRVGKPRLRGHHLRLEAGRRCAHPLVGTMMGNEERGWKRGWKRGWEPWEDGSDADFCGGGG